MPLRSFNFTGRERLVHQGKNLDIQITVTGRAFRLEFFNIEKFQFPPDAVVLVEPYILQHRKYIEYSKVADVAELPSEEKRDLQEFDNINLVRFTVKVVESGGTGKILAAAESVRPVGDIDQEEANALLPVKPADLGSQHWVVDGLELRDPIFKINVKIYQDWLSHARSPNFLNLAYPAAFQQILTYILLVDKTSDIERGDIFSEWLDFGRDLTNEQPPETENDSVSDQEVMDWIEKAVKRLTEEIEKIIGKEGAGD